MAGQFLSIMPTADRRTADGRSSVEQRVFGGSPHWLPCMMDYSGSMISSRTRSLNGKVIHANRRSPFANCLAKLTESKPLRVFSAHRFETETRWQFGCRRLPNPDRLSFMARAIFRSFQSCCAGRLKGRSTIAYFEGHVSDRLGLHRLNYKKDSVGNPLLATGFELTAREWARFGELVLGNGNYHGRQIVPAPLLREAFTGSQINPSYGLTFWLNQQAPNGREADMERMLDLPWQNAQWTDVCICKEAPADMVVALGSHYQRLFIIPSLKAVIVRQGSGGNFSDAQFLRLVLG